ncbi:MAG TPA: DUF202 domain-containing protein [Microbacterium sp.]|nr:DUF202 domain-containing protein [Microbacterium sp.]
MSQVEGRPLRRFPQRVFGVGAEPDVRFSLANERTFLAWVRTALALIAAGVALEVLGLDLHPQLQLTSAIVLVVTGVLVPVLAWTDWMRSERAIRLGEPLPRSILGVLLPIAVSGVGVLVLLALLLR